ncbi:MAG: hypothetical protein AAFV88_25420, partial [Planctomycetota bacterium]
MMNADRYAKIRELFLAADELPRGQQESFLQEQCGEDQELYEEVRSLLGEHDEVSARIEGDSAKQPVIPPDSGTRTGVSEDQASAELTSEPVHSTGQMGSTTELSSATEVGTISKDAGSLENELAPSAQAPFLPSGHPVGDSSARSADDFQRRRDPE